MIELNRFAEAFTVGLCGATMSNIVYRIAVKVRGDSSDQLTWWFGNLTIGVITHLIAEYFRRGSFMKMTKDLIMGPSFVPLKTPRARNIRTVSSKDVLGLLKKT
ncbi:unnamed protein product [Pylaiella littoralis]